MSEFLESPIINKEIQEIMKLQERVIYETFHYHRLSREERIQHVENLEELLDKQRVFHFRLNISEDPEAKYLLTKMLNAAKMSGMIPSGGIEEAFKLLEKKIETLKESLDIGD